MLLKHLNFPSLQAAEKLKITATELSKLQIADGIIPVIFLFLSYHIFVVFVSIFYQMVKILFRKIKRMVMMLVVTREGT